MDIAPKPILAARLKARREAKGVDQHDVADELGVTQPAVCGWEDPEGNFPSREHWSPLARYYGVGVVELFFVMDDAAGHKAEG